jgi:AraC family transcriptional regulator
MKTNMEKALASVFFNNRERNFHHTTYDEEMLQYELLKQGDDQSIQMGKQAFENAVPSLLSDDQLRGWKYMFVASTTLCCRYCMGGGMDSETSYNISDLYIRKVDGCSTVKEIYELHNAMFEEYKDRMKRITRTEESSLPVLRSMDYIDRHLHERITLHSLANYTGTTDTYLSMLFKKEEGITITEYIRSTKIEASKVLLQYYDLTVTEIAEYLAFSSSSHFIRIFREVTGMTPETYRKKYFRKWKD